MFDARLFARRAIFAGAALALSLHLAGGIVAAGPVADFETALNAAYADYRMALVLTNQKNADGTMKAIAGFEAKWSGARRDLRQGAAAALCRRRPSSRPTLASVAAINERAKRLAADGKLAESHDVLEAIREELGHLRLRNGLMTLLRPHERVSTRRWKTLVARPMTAFPPPVWPSCARTSAVLVVPGRRHQAPSVGRTPPRPTSATAAAGRCSTRSTPCRRAARSGDGEASEGALAKLKRGSIRGCSPSSADGWIGRGREATVGELLHLAGQAQDEDQHLGHRLVELDRDFVADLDFRQRPRQRRVLFDRHAMRARGLDDLVGRSRPCPWRRRAGLRPCPCRSAGRPRAEWSGARS